MSDQLLPGQIIRLQDGLWYVDSVTASGAHCIGLSGFPAPITTRKKVTKVVKRHKRMKVIAANSMVEVIDPARLDMNTIRRRISMARKTEAEAQTEGQEETTTEAAPAATPERATQRYLRTDKAVKSEMRGQGKLVLDAIVKLGTPVNVADLVKEIGKFEGSRQDPERVVGFYLSKFKREGLVKVASGDAEGAKTEEPAAAEV